MPTPPKQVAHLLRRAGFGGSAASIKTLSQKSLAEVVSTLVDAAPTAPPRPAFLMPGQSLTGLDIKLNYWWYDRMVHTTTPFLEKMALFWHGHFTSSTAKCDVNAMFDQYTLFYTRGLGSFEQLAQSVAIDPAMLRYLDNCISTVQNRNENFAREALELFLLGVNLYTQQDVVTHAKAWTGHSVNQDSGKYEFRSFQHDNTAKTFMGITKNWNGPDVFHYLLTDPKQRTIVAQHIVDKMWTFFAGAKVPAAVSSALVKVFLGSNFSTKSVMRALFLRPEFYTADVVHGHVRSPAEFFTAIARYTGLSPSNMNFSDYWGLMGQQLFAPPNVKGWDGGETWIATTPIWAKGNFANALADKSGTTIFANTTSMTPAAAVQSALDKFGIDTVSANTRSAMEEAVTHERTAGEHKEHVPLLVMTLLSPEFQIA